jgi:hypothetical protein
VDADFVDTYKDSVVPVSDYIVDLGKKSSISTQCRISILPQKEVHFKRLNAAGDLGAVFLFEWPGFYSPVNPRASALNINNFFPEVYRDVAFCRTNNP